MLFLGNKRTLIMTSNFFTCIFIISTLFFFVHALSSERVLLDSNQMSKSTSIRNRCNSSTINYIDYSCSLLLGIFINIKQIRNLGVL